jgi:hypothetical protein
VKGGNLYYRCRFCGKEFVNSHAPDAMIVAIDTTLGKKLTDYGILPGHARGRMSNDATLTETNALLDSVRQSEKWRQARIKRLYKELNANSLARAGIIEELEALGENPRKEERRKV